MSHGGLRVYSQRSKGAVRFYVIALNSKHLSAMWNKLTQFATHIKIKADSNGKCNPSGSLDTLMAIPVLWSSELAPEKWTGS
jgi:peroxiredoxin